MSGPRPVHTYTINLEPVPDWFTEAFRDLGAFVRLDQRIRQGEATVTTVDDLRRMAEELEREEGITMDDHPGDLCPVCGNLIRFGTPRCQCTGTKLRVRVTELETENEQLRHKLHVIPDHECRHRGGNDMSDDCPNGPLRHDHHGCTLCKRQRNWAADRIETLQAELSAITEAPTPHELLTELFEAVHGETWARPDAPAVVWADLLDDVRNLRTMNRTLTDQRWG